MATAALVEAMIRHALPEQKKKSGQRRNKYGFRNSDSDLISSRVERRFHRITSVLEKITGSSQSAHPVVR